MAKIKIADQEQRDQARMERARDVMVIAGAGGGKTTLLVQRFIEMVAPSDDKTKPYQVSRLVAVTFTRRAAGELKNGITIELLKLIDDPDTSKTRRERATQALSELDQAIIGTIHSFADHLLRLFPVEAEISPFYQLLEDESALVEETLQRWRYGSLNDCLADQWHDAELRPREAQIKIAEEWFRTLNRARVRMDFWDGVNAKKGIRSLVEAWVRNRDKALPKSYPVKFDLAKFNKEFEEKVLKFSDLVDAESANTSTGLVLLRNSVSDLKDALEQENLPEKFYYIGQAFRDIGKLNMGDDLALKQKDDLWQFYNNQIKKGGWVNPAIKSLSQLIAQPAAEVAAVILSLYEDIKAKHESIDFLDSLIKLRKLVQEKPEIAALYAARFDHIFVDECQDTDPLQAEIILAIFNKKGSITIIGDPKQSIYRFRRADIGQYQRMIEVLRKRKALEVTLSVNFRSRPDLIAGFNDVFPAYFDSVPGEGDFDSSTGKVAYSALDASPEIGKSKVPSLRVLRLKLAPGTKPNAKDGRPQEAKLLARHLKWLTSDECDLRVRRKNEQGKWVEERIKKTDIAVLCRAMTNISPLIDELRTLGISAYISGSDRFAKTSLVQKYILVLGAIADREDGVGMFAWHQFPFSSVTALESAAATKEAEAFKVWLTELRRQRHARPVLQTALDVIERSLASSVLSLGVNADQDLAQLYRVATILADFAADNSCDFDEAVRWLREWIDTPPKLNAPLSEGEESLTILSIHQAKGLEFPVVILFDGFSWEGSDQGEAFRVSEDGKQWSMKVGDIDAEFPFGETSHSINDFEDQQLSAEQKRLHYVAATRAKDFLIIPLPDVENSKAQFRQVWGKLLSGKPAVKPHVYPSAQANDKADFLAPYRPVVEFDPKKLTKKKSKASANEPVFGIENQSVTTVATTGAMPKIEQEVQIVSESSTGVVVVQSHIRTVGGADFGVVVHRALHLHLGGGFPIDAAVKAALRETPSESAHAKEIQACVKKGTDQLKAKGYLDGSWQILCEVPFASEFVGKDKKRLMLSGVMDLLLVRGSEAVVVDYKTDRDLDDKAAGSYAKQLAIYEDAVRRDLQGVETMRGELVRL